MKKYKLKKRGVLLGSIFLAVTIIIMIIILTTRNIIMQKRLSNEVDRLTAMNIMTDKYDTKIQAKGNYGKIEKAIKFYLKDYSDSLQEVIRIINDEKLQKILSAENYKNDGPEFKNTIAYLEETQKSFNENMNNLVKLSEKEEIMKYIKREKLDKYYTKLYQNYMFDEGIETNIKDSQLQLEATTNSINNLINIDLEVIRFLIANKDEWKVEEDAIVFYKESLLNRYNELVSKIK